MYDHGLKTKKGKSMWQWKRINSNYIHVSDENGWNKARFIRKSCNDAWQRFVIEGEVPFTTSSPEFKAMLPRSSRGKPSKSKQANSFFYGIRVDEDLASALGEIPKEEIRNLLKDYIKKRKNKKDIDQPQK